MILASLIALARRDARRLRGDRVAARERDARPRALPRALLRRRLDRRLRALGDDVLDVPLPSRSTSRTCSATRRSQAGLRFLPLTLLSFFVAPIAANALDRVPVRALMGVGLLLAGLGLLLMRGVAAGRRLDRAAARLHRRRHRRRHGQPDDRRDRARRRRPRRAPAWPPGSTRPSARSGSRPASPSLGRRLLLADRLEISSQLAGAPPAIRATASSPTRSPPARSTRPSPTCPRDCSDGLIAPATPSSSRLQRDPPDRRDRRDRRRLLGFLRDPPQRLRRRAAGRARAGSQRARAAARAGRLAQRVAVFRERVRGREVEVAVVGARPPATSAGRGAAERRGLAPRAAEREAAQEAGRERVAAAGRVDDLDRRRRGRARLPSASTTSAPSAPQVAATQPTPRSTSARQPASRSSVAGEAEHLLVVGQQVVEVGERGRDPVEDRRGSPGARRSAEVVTPRARARARGSAPPPRRP